MKIDYRTLVWTIGGYFLILIVGAKVMEWLDMTLWLCIAGCMLGGMIGFLLDQYYKNKDLCSEEKGFIKEWAEDDVWDKEEDLK